MNLTVLEARRFVSKYTRCEREVKDYEIDMELTSGRIYTYGDTVAYPLSRGDVIVRRPHGWVRSEGSQDTYILTLDLHGAPRPEAYSRNVPGAIQPPVENGLIDRLTPVIHPTNPRQIEAIYRRLTVMPTHSCAAASELVHELIYTLNAEISRKNYELLTPMSTVADRIIAYMQENLSSRITLDDLSRLVCLERSYLLRLFRSETGKTPIGALIEMRLDKASDLVTATDLAIGEIAGECGYTATSFFISEYKKRYGMTPEAHRRAVKEIIS